MGTDSLVSACSLRSFLRLEDAENQQSEIRFTAMATYNVADAKFDAVTFDETAIRTRLMNTEHPTGDLEHQIFDLSDVVQFSDLDYEYVQIGLSAEYRLRSDLTLTADGEFRDLTDNSGGYVFGEETGQLFIIRTGAKIGP